ncbi:unnamed protein product [Cylindrotheca closterium]|uniref:Multidrug and toxin extrusion protein n=1 Tax=Cylindrotheca closterium TaxID=2856 RepID=A0AAD2G4H9_9STRA|nr:unnamed protein product [Cylindrotheca closterium]
MSENHSEDSNGEGEKAKLNNIRTELWLFLQLAIPTTILNLGFIVSPLLTASHIGRTFEPAFLSGFTLANLTGNLCTFSLMSGLFGAADTLGPQAFGAGKKKEVGLIALRGFACAICLLLPISLILVFYIKDILIALGQDEEASKHASEWYRIYVLSFPFNITYMAIWKFLSAQHVMKPLIMASIPSCAVVLPLALDVLTESFGFVGSALAYVVFQAFQALFLIVYLWWKKPYEDGTWPGIECWREAIFQYKPMKEYIHLGIGGMFAQSEWIFWEALGLIIGLLGVVPLSVHTIPNQVTMLLCLAPFSAGTALTIRMGSTLPIDVSHAKRIAVVCVLLTVAVFSVVNFVAYISSDWIIGLFTNDEDVTELANAIWWKVCIFNVSVATFGALTGVANGLGMQWTLAGVNIFWLWVVGLPAIYYMAYVREGGVESAWSWINYPYVGMNSCLIAAYAMTNWYQIADKIQKEEVMHPPVYLGHMMENFERAPLINSTNENTKSKQYGSDFQEQGI